MTQGGSYVLDSFLISFDYSFIFGGRGESLLIFLYFFPWLPFPITIFTILQMTPSFILSKAIKKMKHESKLAKCFFFAFSLSLSQKTAPFFLYNCCCLPWIINGQPEYYTITQTYRNVFCNAFYNPTRLSRICRKFHKLGPGGHAHGT